MNIKITVFLDIMPGMNVLEEPVYQATQHHVSEGQNLKIVGIVPLDFSVCTFVWL